MAYNVMPSKLGSLFAKRQTTGGAPLAAFLGLLRNRKETEELVTKVTLAKEPASRNHGPSLMDFLEGSSIELP